MLFDVGHPIRRGCLASIVLLVAASCGSSGVPEEPQPGNGTSTAMEVPMTFRASGTASESRGATEDALGNNFAVAAWKTNASGAKEMVMSKDDKGNSPYIVRYDAGHSWHYGDIDRQYLKYWDFSAQDYTFYAIANYEAVETAYPGTAFSNGFVNIKGVKGHLAPADAIPPLLECHYQRVASPVADYDLLSGSNEAFYTPGAHGAIPAMGDIVPLVFHHVMAEVQFKIYNSDKVEIPINTIKIDIDGRGLYGKANYTAPKYFVYSDDDVDLITSYFTEESVIGKSISADKENPTLLARYVELPQALIQDVYVEIESEKGVFFGKFPLGNTQNGRKWEKNTVYTYTLMVTMNSDIILVEVAVDPWEEYEGKNDITQTNW